MPRVKVISDDAVVEAALVVLAELGPSFTLTDIAKQVNLSRATLIQRFGDRRAILVRMGEFQVEQTRRWLASLSLTELPELWDFLETIVEAMGEGQGFSAHVAIAALEVRDPQLRRFASERYRLVQEAIAERLVGRHPEPAAAAAHLHAVIAGATMQWVTDPEPTTLASYVLTRLRWAVDQIQLA